MKKNVIVLSVIISFVISWTGVDVYSAENFPTKSINLLVGFNPGGTADLPARALADVAGKVLGQPIVVVNREGGGGSVALGELKNTAPDGYTIGFLAAGGIMSAHMRKVPYHPVDDFEPIIQYSIAIYGLVVRSDSQYKTLKDLINYAQANPNKIKYATAGAGTPQHLVMLQLEELANVKWTQIPFGSGNEAVTALLGGHVDCVSQSSEWRPFVESGQLRLLAMYSDKRLELFPNAPTLIEQGYKLVAPSIFSLVAPKGTPKDRIKILHDALYKGTQNPEFNNVLKKFNMPLIYRHSQDTAKEIKEIYESSGKIISKLQKK